MLRLAAFPIPTRDNDQRCYKFNRKRGFSYIISQSALSHHQGAQSTRLVFMNKVDSVLSITALMDTYASFSGILLIEGAFKQRRVEFESTSLKAENITARGEKETALQVLSSVISQIAVGRSSSIELIPYFPCTMESPTPVSLVSHCQEVLNDSPTHVLWSEWRPTSKSRFKCVSIKPYLASSRDEVVPYLAAVKSTNLALCENNFQVMQSPQQATDMDALDEQRDVVDDHLLLGDLIPFHESVAFWHVHVTHVMYRQGIQPTSLDFFIALCWTRQYACSAEKELVPAGAVIPCATGLPDSVCADLAGCDSDQDTPHMWQNDSMLDREIFLLNSQTLCLGFSHDQFAKRSDSSLLRTSDHYICLAYSSSVVGSSICMHPLKAKFTDSRKLTSLQGPDRNYHMLHRASTQHFPLLQYDQTQRFQNAATFPMSFMSFMPLSNAFKQELSVLFPSSKIGSLAAHPMEFISIRWDSLGSQATVPKLSFFHFVDATLTLFGLSESLYDIAMDTLAELEAPVYPLKIDLEEEQVIVNNVCTDPNEEASEQHVRTQASVVSNEILSPSSRDASHQPELENPPISTTVRDIDVLHSQEHEDLAAGAAVAANVKSILNNLQSLDIDQVLGLNRHLIHESETEESIRYAVVDEPPPSVEPVLLSSTYQEQSRDHVVSPQVIKPQHKRMSICEGVSILLAEDLLEIMPNLCGHLQENYGIRCIDAPILYADIMLNASTGLVIFDPNSLVDFQAYQARLHYMAQLVLRCTCIYVIFAHDRSLSPSDLDRKYLELCRSTMRFPQTVVIRTCEYEIQSLSSCIAYALQHTLVASLRVPTWTKERLGSRPFLDSLIQGDNTPSCMMLQLFPTINFYLAAQLVAACPVQSLCMMKDAGFVRDYFVKWNAQHDDLSKHVQDLLKLLHVHIGLIA
ncbi:hypothetical protein EON65_02710 [archaeon]|nr:MAG: hypothetical protein EON65_02710 [archaeon]